MSESTTNKSGTRILHVITGLHTGGAEMMLYKILKELGSDDDYEHMVISIQGEGELTEIVRKHSVSVLNFDIRKFYRHPLRIISLIAQTRRFNPDIIQGWMYHGNILGLILSGITSRRIPVVWNLRCSEPTKSGVITTLLRNLCIRVSHKPKVIIANSHDGLAYHHSIGYKPSKSLVIPNGIDIKKFFRDDKKRSMFRKKFGFSDNEFLVGIAAAFSEMKDFPNFLRAVEYFEKKFPEVRFVAAGRNINANNLQITETLDRLNLATKVTLIDEQRDISSFMNGIDLFTLSSKTGEGFPNVIGEAMSCQTPCVATDVGDCKRIIAEFGRSVPANSPEQLAAGWLYMYELDSNKLQKMGRSARQHIIENYQIENIGIEYKNLYKSLLLH